MPDFRRPRRAYSSEAEAGTWLPIRAGKDAFALAGPEAEFHARLVGVPGPEVGDRAWQGRAADANSEPVPSAGRIAIMIVIAVMIVATCVAVLVIVAVLPVVSMIAVIIAIVAIVFVVPRPWS